MKKFTVEDKEKYDNCHTLKSKDSLGKNSMNESLEKMMKNPLIFSPSEDKENINPCFNKEFKEFFQNIELNNPSKLIDRDKSLWGNALFGFNN